mmetsp:Transcript_48153/g.104289  ORF Transcript_48153/g.104289 Transcript_48153/m.104289 type:complete len:132 (+) Transcript_48153:421-816(+)
MRLLLIQLFVKCAPPTYVSATTTDSTDGLNTARSSRDSLFTASPRCAGLQFARIVLHACRAAHSIVSAMPARVQILPTQPPSVMHAQVAIESHGDASLQSTFTDELSVLTQQCAARPHGQGTTCPPARLRS